MQRSIRTFIGYPLPRRLGRHRCLALIMNRKQAAASPLGVFMKLWALASAFRKDRRVDPSSRKPSESF